jgi:hypothetical protein
VGRKEHQQQPNNDVPNAVTLAYIARTIKAANAGDASAAAEALSLFREAVDARNIDGTSVIYRKLAEYVAERFWSFESTAFPLENALGTGQKRGPGQPKGSSKVGEDSYAALMVLLTRRFKSASKAKDRIIQLESDATGKSIVSKSTLDAIYTSYKSTRDLDHDLLVVMLSPSHRKLFKNTLG